jgi:hypothetical protein
LALLRRAVDLRICVVVVVLTCVGVVDNRLEMCERGLYKDGIDPKKRRGRRDKGRGKKENV